VLYTGQEDAVQRVRERVKLMLKGKSIKKPPKNLAFWVHAGIDLDAEDWHKKLRRRFAVMASS